MGRYDHFCVAGFVLCGRSVFIHADRAYRIERYRSIYKTTEEEAAKTVTRCDKERANYFRNYTGCDMTDAQNYNLAIDTSQLPHLDDAVALILRYVELRRGGCAT